MKITSFKQYARYAMPLLSVLVIAASVLGGVFINQPATSAAGLKSVAQCRSQHGGGTQNTAYVSCVNNQTHEAMVYRAYRAVLGRAPENDKAGFNYWVSVARASATPETTVAAKMMTTAEYKQTPYAIENGQPSQQVSWVGELYKRSLNRKGDMPGIQYWANLLTRDSRGGDRRWTRAEVTASFTQSTEAKNSPMTVINAPCYVTYDACADQ